MKYLILILLITGCAHSVSHDPFSLAPHVVVVSKGEWMGTGFILGNHIVTCKHVIDGDGPLTITFFNRSVCTGRLVKTNAPNDLALIEVARLPKLSPLQTSTSLRSGMIFQIGHPRNCHFELTEGTIVDLTSWRNRIYIRTDANTMTGNSGSPVFNDRFELIGMTQGSLPTKTGFDGLILPVSDILSFVGS